MSNTIESAGCGSSLSVFGMVRMMAVVPASQYETYTRVLSAEAAANRRNLAVSHCGNTGESGLSMSGWPGMSMMTSTGIVLLMLLSEVLMTVRRGTTQGGTSFGSEQVAAIW